MHCVETTNLSEIHLFTTTLDRAGQNQPHHSVFVIWGFVADADILFLNPFSMVNSLTQRQRQVAQRINFTASVPEPVKPLQKDVSACEIQGDHGWHLVVNLENSLPKCVGLLSRSALHLPRQIRPQTVTHNVTSVYNPQCGERCKQEHPIDRLKPAPIEAGLVHIPEEPRSATTQQLILRAGSPMEIQKDCAPAPRTSIYASDIR